MIGKGKVVVWISRPSTLWAALLLDWEFLWDWRRLEVWVLTWADGSPVKKEFLGVVAGALGRF